MHLLQTIDDILDHSRSRASAIECLDGPVHLNLLVYEVVELLALRPLGPLVAVELDARRPTLVADPLRVRQVVLGLLSSATRAWSAPSVIVGTRDRQGAVEIRVTFPHGRPAGLDLEAPSGLARQLGGSLTEGEKDLVVTLPRDRNARLAKVA